MGESDKPVPKRSLDAVFRHVLTPDDALKAKLRAEGYDLDDPQPLYSVQTHKACLNLGRLHLFADESEAEGFRKLGQLWATGFAQTVVGVVLAAAARVIGTERVLARLPSYMRAGRTDFRIDVEAHGPRNWRLKAEDPYRPLPHFTAGVLTAIVLMTGARTVDVTVIRHEATSFELQIRWTD